MTRLKRPLTCAGAAALLALSLTACGGGPPADASVEDFCDVSLGIGNSEEIGTAFQKEDWDKVAELLDERVAEIEEIGTPEDIPGEAREGFEIQIEAAKDVTAEDVEHAASDEEDPFEAGLSDDELDKVEAYDKYIAKTCSGE